MIILTFFLIQLTALVLFSRTVSALDRRVKALEEKKNQSAPVFRAPQPIPDWQKPVENFTPKQPQTLRPEGGKAIEIMPGVFDFE